MLSFSFTRPLCLLVTPSLSPSHPFKQPSPFYHPSKHTHHPLPPCPPLQNTPVTITLQTPLPNTSYPPSVTPNTPTAIIQASLSSPVNCYHPCRVPADYKDIKNSEEELRDAEYLRMELGKLIGERFLPNMTDFLGIYGRVSV